MHSDACAATRRLARDVNYRKKIRFVKKKHQYGFYGSAVIDHSSMKKDGRVLSLGRDHRHITLAREKGSAKNTPLFNICFNKIIQPG
jgi:hypothetical protein